MKFKGALFTVALVGGCTDGETGIADLDVESLSLFIYTNAMEGTLHLRDPGDPCVFLGEDARARINDVELNLDRGGTVQCHPDDVVCQNGPRCREPTIDISGQPPIEDATLVLEDASGSISCRLGDAIANRTLTRVGADSWDLARGESVTVRVSHASDLTRFAPSIYLVPPSKLIPHTISGDTIAFEIPADTPTGPQAFWLHLDGEDLPDCDVPAHTLREYLIQQRITVQ